MKNEPILNLREGVQKAAEAYISGTSYVREALEDAIAAENKATDNVHHPKHYELADGVEAIDVIRSVTGEGFPAYCRGNAIKHLCRADHKGGVEDLRKAMVYIGWEIEAREAI